MSRRTDVVKSLLMRRIRRNAEEEGFSLVEVMVAMLVFAVVAVAALGFLTTALSATSVARLEGVAKNIGQERLEGMRNLPFHIAATVSTAPDLLDTFYASTAPGAAAATTSSTGYVSATGARDTAKGDPATGAFFRKVYPVGTITGFPMFSQRITSQFMASDSALLANPVFVSTSTGLDGLPPASTLGVRVSTLWKASGKNKVSTVYSQIAEAAARPPLVTLQARLAMVRYSGLLPLNRELVAEAGTLSLDGALGNSTSASAVAQGGLATIAGGPRVDGAKKSAAAPPSTPTPLSDTRGPQQLVDGTLTPAMLSNTAVSGISASALNGQPGAGSSTAPVFSRLLGAGGFGDSELVLGAGNEPSLTSRLNLTDTNVKLRVPNCGGGCTAVEAKGWLSSVGGASHSATSRLEGTMAGTLVVLPTTQSPDGLIRVTLSSFSAVCDSRAGTSPAATASMTYAGTVSHRTYNPTTGAYGYSTPVPISSSLGTDPLAAIPLATTAVGLSTDGTILYLGDYVQTWSSLTSTTITAGKQLASNGSSVSIAMPGVLTIASRALRDETESTMGVQVAAASCVAADIR